MSQKRKISMMLIIILLIQLILPIITATKVVAIVNGNEIEELNNTIQESVETNLETIKFGSSSEENNKIEENSKETVKETGTILENTENLSEAYLEWSELSEEEKQNTIEPRKEYIDISELETNEQYVKLEASIPERYNLRDILTNIKTENQGSAGNCYAYAGLNSIETNIALKSGTMYDFSEMHIEYMTSNLLGENRTLNAGGNFQTVTKYSKDLQGPVLESEIANKSYTEEEYVLLKSAKPIVTVSETIEFPTINKRYGYTQEQLTEFRESVKTHIMGNGSVYASIYFSESSKYYNSSTKGYSCLDTSVMTNHAVSIIGWDDNYSAENFPETNRPINNGAWIALNSHGSSFGDNGVFYISYEDNWVEYNMSGIVSATEFVDTYGPKVELTNYKNENNTLSTTVNIFDVGGSGVNTSSLKYQWTQNSEQPSLESFSTSFTNGDTLSKTYADGEQWYLWILAYDTENNYSISGAVQELKFTDVNFYNALCYVLSDSVISSKKNEDNTYSIFMTQDSIEDLKHLSLSAGLDYPLPNNHATDQINNIEGIEQFINLEQLNLFGNNISVIDNIILPSGLEYLNIGGNKLTSIKNIVFPEGLKTLLIYQNDSLKEINVKFPSGLEEINLHGNHSIENWESIDFPENLKILYLPDCNLGNKIEKLDLPISITELYIGANSITDIKFLKNLINIEKLCIGANKINDISVIENFSKLKSFKAGDTYAVGGAGYFGKETNNISNINNISFPDTIKELDLGHNKITDASSVDWPDSLKYVYLDNNLIENISIEMGNDFYYLDLSYNNIKDLSEIEISNKCTTNRQIDFSNNKIENIPTESWQNSRIDALILSNNNISNIDEVIWPEYLDSLAINDNNISTLNNVVWKNNLRYLILNNNNISEIKNITWPESLKAIEIAGNNITDLSWIESGTNLIGVALNENKITDIQSLSVLSKLKELHADNNYVEDITPIENLSSLSQLSIKKQYICKIIEDNQNTTQLPQIVKSSTIRGSKVYSEDSMTQKNCNISGENIVFDINELGNIYIMINGGNADGTIVYITDSAENQLIKSVYKVKTKEDLVKIRDNIVNNGFYDLSNSTIELENDIDLGGYYNTETKSWEGDTWIPIGNQEYPFAGKFEGNEFKIKGLYINSNEDYQGFIGCNGGTIQNLTVEGYISSTGICIGGICGESVPGENSNDQVTINNCNNNVKIDSDSGFIGGICGRTRGATILITNSYNSGEINGTYNISGICGYSYGRTIIENCYNTGKINGDHSIGGVLGQADGDTNNTKCGIEINNCFNIGYIKGNNNIGGIVGESRGKYSSINKCYNVGAIEANRYVGNIVGRFDKGSRYKEIGTVKNCYYSNLSNIKAINNNIDDIENKVYGLDSSYMKTLEFVNILNDGNQESIWKIDAESNYKYPVFTWQTSYPDYKEPTLVEIAVTTAPNKTTYNEGENFNPSGMKIKLTYENGYIKEVTNYTIIDGNDLPAGKTSVTISYTENGVTKTVTQPITVVAKKLTEIKVTTIPSNTTYIEGQNFNPAGMKVTATYNNGISKEITNYTITDGNNLALGKTSVTISCIENGVTKTTTQAITVVAKKLTGITVTTAPSNTTYIEGQNFNPAGMKVTATYNDGDTKEITNYTITDGNNLSLGKTSVTISYTENGITKTTNQNITVTEKVIAKGDINKDGQINTLDMVKILRYIAASKNQSTQDKYPTWNLEGESLTAADINGDGKVNTMDLLKILRHISASKDSATAEAHPDWIIK